MSNQVTIFELSSNVEEILCLKNIREDEDYPLIVRAFCLAEILYAEDESMFEEVCLMLKARAEKSAKDFVMLPMWQALRINDMKDGKRKHAAIKDASSEVCSLVAILDEDFASRMSAFHSVCDKKFLLSIAVYSLDSFIRYQAFEKIFELYPEFSYSNLLPGIYENEEHPDNRYLLVKNAKLTSFIEFVALSKDCEVAQVNALMKCKSQLVFESIISDKSYGIHPRMIAARYLKDIDMRTTMLLEGGKLKEDGKTHEDDRILWELIQGPQKEETFINILGDTTFWLNGRIEAAKRVSDLNYIQERLKTETNYKVLEILAERLK